MMLDAARAIRQLRAQIDEDKTMSDPEYLRRTIGKVIADLEALPQRNRAMQNLLENLQDAAEQYDRAAAREPKAKPS